MAISAKDKSEIREIVANSLKAVLTSDNPGLLNKFVGQETCKARHTTMNVLLTLIILLLLSTFGVSTAAAVHSTRATAAVDSLKTYMTINIAPLHRGPGLGK